MEGERAIPNGHVTTIPGRWEDTHRWGDILCDHCWQVRVKGSQFCKDHQPEEEKFNGVQVSTVR